MGVVSLNNFLHIPGLREVVDTAECNSLFRTKRSQMEKISGGGANLAVILGLLLDLLRVGGMRHEDHDRGGWVSLEKRWG